MATHLKENGFLLPRHLSDGTYVGFRFHGIAGEPRDAFSYLMLSLGIFTLRDIWEDKKKLTLFWIILIITSAFLTESFSGILGIVFFGILILIYYEKEPHKYISPINKFEYYSSERLYKYYHELFELYSLLDKGLFGKFTGFVYDVDGNIDDVGVIGTVYQYSMVNVFPIWHLWTEIREFNFLHFFIGNGLGSASVINRYYMHSIEMLNPNANIIRSL